MPLVLPEDRRDSGLCVRREVRTGSSNFFVSRFLTHLPLQLSLDPIPEVLGAANSPLFWRVPQCKPGGLWVLSPTVSLKGSFLSHLSRLSPLGLLSSPHCTATISSPPALYLCRRRLQTNDQTNHSSVILVHFMKKFIYLVCHHKNLRLLIFIYLSNFFLKTFEIMYMSISCFFIFPEIMSSIY